MTDILNQVTSGNVALAVVLALFWWRMERIQKTQSEERDELTEQMLDLKREVEKHTDKLKEDVDEIRQNGYSIYQRMIDDHNRAMSAITGQITSAFERIIDKLAQRA